MIFASQTCQVLKTWQVLNPIGELPLDTQQKVS
jgi:hypothetical protein